MLLNTIAEKHPNSFVLLLPKARDEQNRVRDWQVLNTSRHYDEILKVEKYYRAEGMNDAVICSTWDAITSENSEVDDDTASTDEDSPVMDSSINEPTEEAVNTESEFTSILAEDIPKIEKYLIPLNPQCLMDYAEEEQ